MTQTHIEQVCDKLHKLLNPTSAESWFTALSPEKQQVEIASQLSQLFNAGGKIKDEASVMLSSLSADDINKIQKTYLANHPERKLFMHQNIFAENSIIYQSLDKIKELKILRMIEEALDSYKKPAPQTEPYYQTKKDAAQVSTINVKPNIATANTNQAATKKDKKSLTKRLPTLFNDPSPKKQIKKTTDTLIRKLSNTPQKRR